MDKKDNNKSLDELFKSSMGQGGANPFLNAASLLGGEGKISFFCRQQQCH